MKPNEHRSDSERLAVIEEVVLRIEDWQKSQDKRITRMERAGAWASGALSTVLAGIGIYVKWHHQ